MANTGGIWDRKTCRRIHSETLKVLKNVGLRVEDAGSVEMLYSAGARVDKSRDKMMVYLPSHLVEDAVDWAPKSVVYHARDPVKDVDTRSGRVGFSTFGECVKIFDPYTRCLRATTKQDGCDTGKLVDYLDELVVMERAVCATEKPPATQPVHNLESLLNNTAKHIIIGAGNRNNCRFMLQMAHVAAGGEKAFARRPIISFSACPSSPLTLTKSACEIITESAGAGAGLWLISMVLAGATGPATLAGSMVQHNAEILGALTLAQLVRKGTPCTYGSSTSIMYLKNAATVLGAPEYGMMGRAAAAMARFYGLPTAIAAGVSDSKITDIQSAYETAINLTQVALARPPIIYGIGSLESGLTFDMTKAVLDCEHARHLKMVVEGIPVNAYELAHPQILEAGPGGTYLLQRHTLENMRCQSQTTVFDRTPRESWEKNGSPSAFDLACRKVIDIIENHTPMPLPPGARETIARLVREYDADAAAFMS